MRELLAALLLPLSLAGADDPRVELTFRDPEIVESSGLAVVGDWVVTTNDSGDTGRVFVVDRDGRTVGVTGWGDPRDVEALAPGGDGTVWVGDIGDNSAVRDSVRVSNVPVGGADADVDGPAYELVYPDGARDAESLLVDPATGCGRTRSSRAGPGPRGTRSGAARPAETSWWSAAPSRRGCRPGSAPAARR